MPIFKKFTLKAEVEKSKRLNIEKTISNSSSARDVLNEFMELNSNLEEVAVVLCLDTKNKIIGTFEVSRGGVRATILNAREVFKRAITINSSSIIIAHNHPSGDTNPSSADIKETKKLVECGEIIGIKVIDHIIVGNIEHNNFTSLREKGVI